MGSVPDTTNPHRLSTRAQLAGRVGDVSQIASGRLIRLTDGPEDGVRAIDVRVAGGIHALVLADRGLDIGPAWYAGEPLAWTSPTGITHPAYWTSDVWLRSFYGGLVFTAGLQNVGAPNTDDGESHGLHGRIGNLPARNVTVETAEENDRLVLVVRGDVRETTVYGEDLVLRRTLRFPVGEPVVEIHDEVVNMGYRPAPLYILYHVNPGYPVLDAGSRLIAPQAQVVGLDDGAKAAEAEHAVFRAPTEDFKAQVFEHRFGPAVPDRVRVSLVNEAYAPTAGIGLSVTFDRRQLPRLWQWRMLAKGLYVTGIEPANCSVQGRSVDRAAGTFPQLAGGASASFDLEIRAAVGPDLKPMMQVG